MKELERLRDRATSTLGQNATLCSAETMEVLRSIMALLQDAAWRLDSLEQSSHKHYGETP